MFIQNKYYKWYQSIVAHSSSSDYVEEHHILPKSLGGSNDASNLVKLSAREHFICHILLTKFTSGEDRYKMVYAAKLLAKAKRSYQHRYFNSRLYETVKKEAAKIQSERFKGKKLSAEHRANISAGLVGRVNSEATIAKRRESCTGKKRTDEQKERMSLAQLNRKEKTVAEKEEIAKKLSQSKKGKKLGPKSDEHKAKLSNAIKGVSKGPMSEDTKQKMRKPKSEAHRKAISEGRKAKYAALKIIY